MATKGSRRYAYSKTHNRNSPAGLKSFFYLVKEMISSGNTLMISTMKNVEAAFSKGMYSAFHIDTDENIQQAIKYHTMILDAIKAKDSAMAQDLMRQHIRSVVHRLGVHRTAKSTSAFTHY